MIRSILTSSLICTVLLSSAQTRIVSVGIFTGPTSTFTWDEGIYQDARYKARYDVKYAPIGFSYGIDYEGFGFVVSPGLTNIGQNFNVTNIVGGHEGTRKINLQYFNLPAAFKLHLIDLSFFKVSFVSGASIAYLMNGQETISHNSSKLKFPVEVYPALPENYIVEYDGILVPEVKKYTMLSTQNFNTLQFFGFLGLRSDWYVTENWRVSFDIRTNYGFTDPRSDDYLKSVKANQRIYDIAGKRRDIVTHLSIGFARYIEVEKKEKERKQRGKNSTPKKFTPKKNPWPAPRKPKPKG